MEFPANNHQYRNPALSEEELFSESNLDRLKDSQRANLRITYQQRLPLVKILIVSKLTTLLRIPDPKDRYLPAANLLDILQDERFSDDVKLFLASTLSTNRDVFIGLGLYTPKKVVSNVNWNNAEDDGEFYPSPFIPGYV